VPRGVWISKLTPSSDSRSGPALTSAARRCRT
jgi:hypothetical protein